MHSGISNIHVNGLQKTIRWFDNIFLNQNPWQDPSHEGAQVGQWHLMQSFKQVTMKDNGLFEVQFIKERWLITTFNHYWHKYGE